MSGFGVHMFFANVLAAAVVVMTLAGCATHAPLLTGAIQPQVTKVAVVKSAEPGSVNMAEDLRVKILQRAPAFAKSGAAKTLEVQITDVNFKNPLMTVLVGDSNRVSVVVKVVDSATGKVEATYNGIVVDSSVINGVAGAIISAADDPIDVEQRLTTSVSKIVLEKLYGTEAAKKAESKPLDSKIAAAYPRQYDDLKVENRCNASAAANAKSAANPSDPFHGKTQPLPPECAAVGVTETKKPASKRT